MDWLGGGAVTVAGLLETPSVTPCQNCLISCQKLGALPGNMEVWVGVGATVGAAGADWGAGLICLAVIISRLRLVPAGQHVMRVMVGSGVAASTLMSLASTTLELAT